MKQEESNSILLEIYKTQQEMKKTQEEMRKEQEEMRKEQEETRKIQEEMKKEQKEMKKTQQEMQEELTRVGNTVTKIEYEHGRKIDLILDVLTGHGEKLEQHDKRFEKNEKIIEIHGHKIYEIEQKIQA